MNFLFWFLGIAVVLGIVTTLLQKYSPPPPEKKPEPPPDLANADQETLARIAREAKNDLLFYDAMNRITDQPLLERIGQEWPDARARQHAVHRIKNRPLLCRIALNDKDDHTRQIAALHCENDEVIAKVAASDPSQYVRDIMSNFIEKRKREAEGIPEKPPPAAAVSCALCGTAFNFQRKIAGGIYAGAQFMESIIRTPYRCRRCGTLICMQCAQTKRCRCRGQVFDAAIETLK